MGVKNGFLRCFALLHQQGIFHVQLRLSTPLGVVLPVSDLLLCTGHQIDLVQPTLLAHRHDLLPEVTHELPGTAVLSPGTAVTGTIHVAFALHVLNPQRVDDDVNVKVPGAMVPVRVRADQRLVAGKVSLAERLAHFLHFLQCEVVVVPVPGVEGNDVVVGLDVAFLLVLFVLQIGLHAVQSEAVRGAEDAGDQILLPWNVVPVLVQKGFSGLLVVLEGEIQLRSAVVGVFAGNMLDNGHQRLP